MQEIEQEGGTSNYSELKKFEWAVPKKEMLNIVHDVTDLFLEFTSGDRNVIVL